MRHYFRYKGGYINIDDENIYLTTTGNWQEISGLKEQKKNSYQKQLKFLLWGMYLVFICICVFRQSYLMLIIVTALLGVNNLFGKTPAYKIPLAKVTSLERNNSAVILKFNNEADETVKVKLKNVPEADYQILAEHLQVIERKNDVAI
jgi:hypothetical protein